VKIALISDIHGNMPALQAVLAEIDRMGVDMILCLGDIVGYGPQPAECIEILMGRNIMSVMGNHEACVVGLLNERFFGEPNRGLLKWTRDILKPEHLEWLERLPMTIQGSIAKSENHSERDLSDPIAVFSYVASHSSPKNPESWEWLDSAIRCREILDEFRVDFIFVGHTHIPALIANEMGVFGLELGYSYLINPGSVGQSRDHDRRASFGILDTGAFTYKNHRVEYDVHSVKAAFRELGYSDFQIKRLLNV
jgi:predicted phosphodiesterase